MTVNQLFKKFAGGAVRGRSGNVYVEGDVCYSYGTHYPAAVRVRDGYALVNATRWSPTTDRHTSGLARALRSAGRTVFEVPNVLAETPEEHADNARWLWQEAADADDKARRARTRGDTRRAEFERRKAAAKEYESVFDAQVMAEAD